jgi:hypothetical protein
VDFPLFLAISSLHECCQSTRHSGKREMSDITRYGSQRWATVLSHSAEPQCWYSVNR